MRADCLEFQPINHPVMLQTFNLKLFCHSLWCLPIFQCNVFENDQSLLAHLIGRKKTNCLLHENYRNYICCDFNNCIWKLITHKWYSKILLSFTSHIPESAHSFLDTLASYGRCLLDVPGVCFVLIETAPALIPVTRAYEEGLACHL